MHVKCDLKYIHKNDMLALISFFMSTGSTYLGYVKHNLLIYVTS